MGGGPEYQASASHAESRAELNERCIPNSEDFNRALELVAQGVLACANFVQTTPTLTQDERFEIAKIAAAQDGWRTSGDIQNYGIKDESKRFEIAKIAAAQKRGFIFEYIQNYDIKDEAKLSEIAKIAAAQDGRLNSQYIQKYGIKDESKLFEIAKIAAAHDGWGTSENIQKYGIKDESKLFEIAKIAAAQNGGGTSICILKYGIKDESKLFEIAKIVAAQSGGGASEYIQNYGIKDESKLIEIAKIAAAQKGGGTSENIQKYGIKDESKLFEIAKIAAAHDGRGTCAHIQKYGIKDESKLFEIAKIAAARSGYFTSSYIQNYGIKDESKLFEIAKIAAAESGGGTCAHIQNYGIKDESKLFEIGKIAAAQNGEGTSQNIQNYGIKDESKLIEIAKIAAAQSGWGTSKYIQSYGIKDESKCFEIAKIAAAQNGLYTSEYIQNYGIKDESKLIEIAKIAAAQDGEGTSKNIQNYGIKDESKRWEIAKIAAARDGEGASKKIQNYDIKDESKLFEIAKIAAAQNGEGASKYIQKYGIQDVQRLQEIALACLRQSLRSMVNLDNFGVSPTAVLKVHLEEVTSGSHKASNFRLFSSFLEGEISGKEALLGLHIHIPDWTTQAPHERLKHIGEWLRQRYDLPAAMFSCESEVQAEESICGALAATIVCWESTHGTDYPNRTRARLAKLTGYELPKSPLSPNSARDLYGVVLQGYDAIGDGISKVVPVDFSRPGDALRVITLATAIKRLGGELPQWEGRVATQEQYSAAEAELQSRLSAAFGKLLNIDKPEHVVELWEKWGGDLTTFCVLASRYQANTAWHAELPVLSEIASHCLDGTFLDWRYRRDDGQLSMLSDEQLSSWRMNPVAIERHEVTGESAEQANESVVSIVRQIYESNLMQHIPADVAAVVCSEPIVAERAEELLTLSEGDFSSKVSLAEAVKLLRYVIDSNDAAKIRTATKLINGCAATLLKGLDAPPARQIREDLKSLNDSSKSISVRAGTSYYVISVITDDPKLLLMTGDLVQTASCQNYRCGSHIQTLPGYVIDGNIKLALSYVVKADVFKKMFPKQAEVTFDPATQTLQAGAKRLSLGHALRREVLRVGSVSGRAACVTERAYVQLHAIAESIQRQQTGLIAAHLADSGIESAGARVTVSHPASRNPLGGYTDRGGGVKIGPYTT